MSQEPMDLDLINRDPNNLNSHVQVLFEDILAEPEGAHSINCVWTNSYKCFNCCKGCCYKLITAICGIPIACCWGIEFALIAVQHIWCITPCMRSYMINCGCMQKFYGTCLQCFIQPCCEAVGFIFNNVRVTKMAG